MSYVKAKNDTASNFWHHTAGDQGCQPVRVAVVWSRDQWSPVGCPYQCANWVIIVAVMSLGVIQTLFQLNTQPTV